MTDSRQCTLVAVGDIFLDRDEPADAFLPVHDLFAANDLVLGNLEAPVTERSELPPWAGKFPLRMRPQMVPALVTAPFSVLSLANNHTMDYGAPALIDTIEALDSAKIPFAGAGRNVADSERAAVVEANGLRVGVVAFQATDHERPDMSATLGRPGLNRLRLSPYFAPPHVDPVDMARLAGAIRAAREVSDVVIAVFHWGLAGSTSLTTTQTGVARAAIAAGADLILGHHAHVPQPVEVIDGRPVVYGLGNFVFDWNFPHFIPARMIAEFTLGADGVKEASVRFAWAEPELELVGLSEDRLAETLDTFRTASEAMGTSFTAHSDGQRLLVGLG